MAQPMIRDKRDAAMRFFEERARQNGTTAQQELDKLRDAGRPYTPEERGALTRYFHSQTLRVLPPLTLEDIREGLE